VKDQRAAQIKKEKERYEKVTKRGITSIPWEKKSSRENYPQTTGKSCDISHLERKLREDWSGRETIVGGP